MSSKRVTVKHIQRGLAPVAVGMLIYLAITLQSCFSSRDGEFERILVSELTSHKTDNISSIDLRTIFGVKWNKACLQGPYMFQSNFEKLTGENVRDFKGLSDDRYVLWIFYSDGHSSRVEIERVRVMDKYSSRGTICTTLHQPFLYFEMDGSEKKYFLNNK
jgi:hypothetical protein